MAPKLGIGFLLKNLKTVVKIKRSSRKRIEQFIASTPQMTQPLIPTFEGTGGPMEEGMLYVLFHSKGKSALSAIDTISRFFWVNAPAIKYAFLDSYLLSERFESGQWATPYQHGILENLSKDRYHQEISLQDAELLIDGSWQEGYHYTFNDYINDIAGTLTLTPIENSVLVYYGGRVAITPSMSQKFYDVFALKAQGEITIQGKTVQITDGRAVIEHGLGVFSTFHIYDWRWLNLHFKEGSVHLFYHSLDLRERDEGILESGEGAATLNEEFVHFLPGTFHIQESRYLKDQSLPTKIPVEWRVTAGNDTTGKPLLDLVMKRIVHRSWIGMGREDEYVTNYIVQAKGTWKGTRIRGSGTMENQMHRIIK